MVETLIEDPFEDPMLCKKCGKYLAEHILPFYVSEWNDTADLQTGDFGVSMEGIFCPPQ